jgi:hypothetical protein
MTDLISMVLSRRPVDEKLPKPSFGANYIVARHLLATLGNRSRWIINWITVNIKRIRR